MIVRSTHFLFAEEKSVRMQAISSTLRKFLKRVIYMRKNTDEYISGNTVKHFNNIIDFAKAVIKEVDQSSKDHEYTREHPVLDVIRLIGRKIQFEYMWNFVLTGENFFQIHPDMFLFDYSEPISRNGKSLRDVRREVKFNRNVLLSRDVVLPWPWNKTSLRTCISHLGEGRPWGAWKQEQNHRIELWLPIGVAWVLNGNHSIATGIIQGTGEIQPEIVYDIGEIYDYVVTDGRHYFRKDDGSIIAPVNSIEFAAIFEIGRLMREKGISF